MAKCLTIKASSSADQKKAIIKVRDTGIGMTIEERSKVFNRYYQADNSTNSIQGTGIGLALTKELVSLLKGEIRVKSEPGKGSEFTVVLPVVRNAPTTNLSPINHSSTYLPMSESAAINIWEDSSATLETKESGIPIVLIIEDNMDVVQYIRSLLTDRYQVETSYDGKQGIEKAYQIIPDIIISDVMMPKIDGFEVTSTLKNDIRTSHIPIILLTAKEDNRSRVTGLKKGADAYLSKPFDREELFIRMLKLLELRQNLQEYYLNRNNSSPDKLIDVKSANKSSAEQDFVMRVREIVKDHIADHQLNVDYLCKEMGLSRSQLHRKLIALTGLSTMKLVRHIRLEEAKSLLTETKQSIAMVAFDTGFKDADYFSRIFHREIGVPPSVYRNQS